MEYRTAAGIYVESGDHRPGRSKHFAAGSDRGLERTAAGVCQHGRIAADGGTGDHCRAGNQFASGVNVDRLFLRRGRRGRRTPAALDFKENGGILPDKGEFFPAVCHSPAGGIQRSVIGRSVADTDIEVKVCDIVQQFVSPLRLIRRHGDGKAAIEFIVARDQVAGFRRVVREIQRDFRIFNNGSRIRCPQFPPDRDRSLQDRCLFPQIQQTAGEDLDIFQISAPPEVETAAGGNGSVGHHCPVINSGKAGNQRVIRVSAGTVDIHGGTVFNLCIQCTAVISDPDVSCFMDHRVFRQGTVINVHEPRTVDPGIGGITEETGMGTDRKAPGGIHLCFQRAPPGKKDAAAAADDGLFRDGIGKDIFISAPDEQRTDRPCPGRQAEAASADPGSGKISLQIHCARLLDQ